jgi:hypothetical protein
VALNAWLWQAKCPPTLVSRDIERSINLEESATFNTFRGGGVELRDAARCARRRIAGKSGRGLRFGGAFTRSVGTSSGRP